MVSTLTAAPDVAVATPLSTYTLPVYWRPFATTGVLPGQHAARVPPHVPTTSRPSERKAMPPTSGRKLPGRKVVMV